MSINRQQLTIGIVSVLTLLLIIATLVMSADRDTSIAPFIPIWFAVFLPTIIAATQKNKEEEEAQKQKRKQKQQLSEVDRYTMMDNLVDDLTENELDYLEQRLAEAEEAENQFYRS